MPDPTAERARGVRHVQIGEAAGQRIDNYLLGEMTGVPRSRVYGMLRKGEVRMNGGRVKPDYRLSDGRRRPNAAVARSGGRRTHAPSRGLLERLAARIIYQDASIIVVDKPAGTAVHGGSGIQHGIIEALRVLFPEERNLELAHRLDRDTSGCLLLAKQPNRAARTARAHFATPPSRRRTTHSYTARGRANFARCARTSRSTSRVPASDACAWFRRANRRERNSRSWNAGAGRHAG